MSGPHVTVPTRTISCSPDEVKEGGIMAEEMEKDDEVDGKRVRGRRVLASGILFTGCAIAFLIDPHPDRRAAKTC